MRINFLDRNVAGRPRHYAKNPTLPNNVYIYHQALYGSYMVKAASALDSQIVFSTPQGGAYTPTGGTAIKLNSYNTNLVGQGGRLPNPDRLCVKYVALHVREDATPTDALRFLTDSVCVLSINSREYWRSHGFRIPGGGGVYSASSAIVSNGQPLVGNQGPTWGPKTMPDGTDIPEELQGEMIEQGENIGFVIDPTLVQDAAASGVYTCVSSINAHVYLDGIWTRGVN